LEFVENSKVTLLNGRMIDSLLQCLRVADSVAHLAATTNQRRPSLTHDEAAYKRPSLTLLTPVAKVINALPRKRIFMAVIRRSYDKVVITHTADFISAPCFKPRAVIDTRADMRADMKTISVVVVPPSIEVTDREIVVTEDDTAELPCSAVGFPQPRISWIKDGRLSLDSTVDARYQLQKAGNLIITDVQVGLIYIRQEVLSSGVFVGSFVRFLEKYRSGFHEIWQRC